MFDDHVCGHQVKARVVKRQPADIGEASMLNGSVAADRRESCVDADDEPRLGHELRLGFPAPFRKDAVAATEVEPSSGCSDAWSEALLEDGLRVQESGRQFPLKTA